MAGIGYKAFGVASKDVNAIGQIQTKLTTIEFGFSPFIPFSKTYNMIISENIAMGLEKGAKNASKVSEDVKKATKSWVMGPGQEGDLKQGTWLNTLNNWRDANYDLQTLVDRQPGSEQRARANVLSEYFSKLLESEGITSKYEGTVKGEVMEQSTTDAALNMSRAEDRNWRNDGFSTPNTVVDKLTKGEGFSNEQIDLTYIDEFQKEILDYSHHRLSANFGNTAIKGSLGIETTDMATHKTFQHTLFEDYGMNTIKTAKQVKDSVEKDLIKMFDMMNSVGGNLQTKYETLVAMGKADKALKKEGSKAKVYNYDPHTYTAAQLLDRFRKVERSWHQKPELEPLYENYIYQMPVGGAQSAYITLEPSFTGSGESLSLVGITVNVEIIDMSDAPPWLKQYFNEASDYSSITGLHSNFILYDMWKNNIFTDFQIEQIARKGSMDAINHLALNIGKAAELAGTSLETETALFPLEAFGKAPVVSTVEILATKDIADSLKLQVLGHFQGAEEEIAGWYSDAMSASSDLTKAWKNKSNSRDVGDFWGNPYDTAKNLSRVGTPFFMTMGRDVSAYKLFKNKIGDISTWERNGFFNPAARVLYQAKGPTGEKMGITGDTINVTKTIREKYQKDGFDASLGPRAVFKPHVPRFM
tara:strand:- start:1153 stop:3084 length:1932 start_codon:yes stop_codon:yes gene_type:complete